ncbi:2-hydroxy-3-oxopropionate reductase [Rhizobium rhizogenes]|uniref:2-hydroxy-3-oxopropionate reductase n=1 Tax=Rhizobium rhizogenes TaxID=359 RepID=A0AAN2A5N7_RHIRH|nr:MULTISPECIES: 2-hydroxy-3-oxopropionate reductase [Rhizobium/Agrobacterium group]AQS60842.1 2-hydroxy-3-oxopropionate reductase [Rhizobium rhizogenes]MCZ7445174.1 2-hydroxy-3-oxopropionate reductase [Rhizobium rhizogenes]NSZ80037.1 2-hydroxy-3-oxopropionate reductase [Agrobacterium tumefaciens]OAM64139.1 2-hydroxy-3-oxopropionate reductase [Rhizobium rhizogenes]CAD0213255.1 2-hydroxy-3-oxopropionate reductase [Rhizobium rhizogenes]
MNIGFIGLGVMGRPMAENLIDAGHALVLNRIKPLSQHLLDKGGKAADTPRAVAQSADIVILMLPDTPDVEAVLFGKDGVAEGLSKGKLVIDMSSISPVATKDFAARIEALRCDYLDAPVSGGEVGARSASLTIMIGGRQAAFDRARPLFEAMGKNITLVGGVGDGQTAKVANQIIVGLTIEAVSEALLFAKRAGADPAKVRSALMGGFAASRVLEVHGERMVRETFDPGFRMRLHRKDMTLAVDAARALDLALPNTAMVQQLMNAAIAGGDGDQDHSALIRTLERIAGGGRM